MIISQLDANVNQLYAMIAYIVWDCLKCKQLGSVERGEWEWDTAIRMSIGRVKETFQKLN